ncbi:MAG: sodium:solute symporter family protein [Bacteroidota bacterium]
MLLTLGIIGAIYIGILVLLALRSRSQEKSSKQYLMGGSSIGAVLGFFTFAATLFSTFTLLGMPDFFRQHGVGAWIFLMISDAVMVFGIIWLGYELRKRAREKEYLGMAGFLKEAYQSKWAGFVAFGGAFIFLVPYVAIQIRGVATFFHAAFPESLPMWAWAVIMVVIMIIYSEVGGLKAIMYSDVLQGILLLIAIWIVGYNCLEHFGGMSKMFEQVAEKNEALLSTPGPKGLFDFQFLLGSMFAIALLPYTQPQISTRVVIMKDVKSLHRMAVGIGFFAILVILPTAFMGMYGAMLYPDASTPDYLNLMFIKDQANIIGAIVMVGLLAAAISTSDSQIFALGAEIRSILSGKDEEMVKIARLSIFAFAIIALIFALLTSDELVALARTSFAGTSLLAPMIFAGIFHKKASSLKILPIFTMLGILLFVASQFKIVPSNLFGIRMDLFILLILSVLTLILTRVNKS